MADHSPSGPNRRLGQRLRVAIDGLFDHAFVTLDCDGVITLGIGAERPVRPILRADCGTAYLSRVPC